MSASAKKIGFGLLAAVTAAVSLNSYFNDQSSVRADTYKGNLVGKVLTIDPVRGEDFAQVYGDLHYGHADVRVTVIGDNEGKTDDRSDVRDITFMDGHGHINYGNAARFNVAKSSL